MSRRPLQHPIGRLAKAQNRMAPGGLLWSESPIPRRYTARVPMLGEDEPVPSIAHWGLQGLNTTGEPWLDAVTGLWRLNMPVHVVSGTFTPQRDADVVWTLHLPATIPDGGDIVLGLESVTGDPYSEITFPGPHSPGTDVVQGLFFPSTVAVFFTAASKERIDAWSTAWGGYWAWDWPYYTDPSQVVMTSRTASEVAASVAASAPGGGPDHG